VPGFWRRPTRLCSFTENCKVLVDLGMRGFGEGNGNGNVRGRRRRIRDTGARIESGSYGV